MKALNYGAFQFRYSRCLRLPSGNGGGGAGERRGRWTKKVLSPPTIPHRILHLEAFLPHRHGLPLLQNLTAKEGLLRGRYGGFPNTAARSDPPAPKEKVPCCSFLKQLREQEHPGPSSSDFRGREKQRVKGYSRKQDSPGHWPNRKGRG